MSSTSSTRKSETLGKGRDPTGLGIPKYTSTSVGCLPSLSRPPHNLKLSELGLPWQFPLRNTLRVEVCAPHALQKMKGPTDHSRCLLSRGIGPGHFPPRGPLQETWHNMHLHLFEGECQKLACMSTFHSLKPPYSLLGLATRGNSE